MFKETLKKMEVLKWNFEAILGINFNFYRITTHLYILSTCLKKFLRKGINFLVMKNCIA